MSGNTNARMQLHALVLEHIDYLEERGGSGSPPQLPEYDLYPRDYLRYASECIEDYGKSGGDRQTKLAIEAVSHLKRAIDSQTEIFLHVFDLVGLFRGRKAGLPARLAFLHQAGIFSGRTLRRMNHIRNQIEHDFAAPQVADLDALFDLTSAFVGVVEGAVLFRLEANVELVIFSDNDEVVGDFVLTFDSDGPAYEVSRRFYDAPDENITLRAAARDSDTFAYFFRVAYVLRRLEVHGSRAHVREMLEPDIG